MAEYKLSASLPGHEDDVRAVCFPSATVAISASRDGTVRMWRYLDGKSPSYDGTIASHATSFVNSVAYLPPNSKYLEGLIVSGGKDTVIEVREPSKAADQNAEALLLGHSHNICALDIDPAGKFIVSGSWDAEARIWPVGKWECSAVLRGHEGSVWAVLAYDSETIITGCADKLIRVFTTNGKLLRTLRGSSDVVRALCKLPEGHSSGAEFASAGNDGIIRLWTLSGKPVGQLHAHENFIYSLACIPSGEIVSSSEDRTVRIWKGSECIQTITHPAISVWGVAVCQDNGDIISGASDRIVRIFTRSSERVANAETLRQFEDAVKESSIPQQALGDSINKENLPGPEFLVQKAGTKEGQVQMIRELNGNITAHTWSAAAKQWINVGTVVDAVGSSGKKVDYLGKEYDYVFDVDIAEGAPPLKLPYNLSQNPYEAATKFIQDNELSMNYLDQVANFITSNTQGATIGKEAVPEAPDPWGSSNRYRPDMNDTSAPSSITSSSAPKSLPQKTYLSILVAKALSIEKKIRDLNSSLLTNGHKDLSLNPTELSTLTSLLSHISSSGATPSTQSILGGLSLAIKLCTVWPYAHRLPGLDLLRLLAVAPATATYVSPRGANIIDILEQGALEDVPPAENHIMMAVRGFVNLFVSAEGRNLAGREFARVQTIVHAAIDGSKNRNLLVAAATLYINYAVLFTSSPPAASSTSDPDLSPNSESSQPEHVLTIIDTLEVILQTQTDAEVVFRALVALGTLLSGGEETRKVVAEGGRLKGVVEGTLKKVVDPRAKNVGKEMLELLDG